MCDFTSLATGEDDLARSGRATSGGGDADEGLAEPDGRAGTELTPTSALDLAVHADLAVLDQAPGPRAVIDDTSQLQELAEPDRLVADGYVEGVAHAAGDIRLARGRQTGCGGIRGLTLALGQGTPHTERLTGPQRVLTTALQDRATQAHGLGSAVPAAACRSSLTLGMEEDVRILTPAGAIQLPLPQICNWPGQARYCGQRVSPSMIRRGCRFADSSQVEG